MEQEFPTVNNLEEFKIPANIKQMGNADKELKIYLEDYVYTYLYQYSRTGGGGEKLAVLIGKHYEVDGVDITAISGAIEARFTECVGDKISFSEESWSYINRQLELYFKGLCVIGWVHIQPDFGTYLMTPEEAFHKECFKEKWQVLFVMDPSERMDAFYCTIPGDTTLRPVRGYFIYYDKNEAMQNYMIENSLIKPKLFPEPEPVAPKSSGKAAVARLLGITRHKKEEATEEAGDDNDTKKVDKPVERTDAAGKIRKVLNAKEETKQKETQNKQIALTAICAALCLASVMMSTNLLNNRTRINNLEAELIDMKASYANINNMLEETTAQVFAAKIVKEEEQKRLEEEEKQKAVEAANIVEPRVYFVEEGDNLLYISNKFYGSGDMIGYIMEVNNLSDENVIFSGEKLIVPEV